MFILLLIQSVLNFCFTFQVRSRVFNLKDKKNRELRENVLCGVILPEKIATMSSEEMASDEVIFLFRPSYPPPRVSYVHSLMSNKDLHATINPHTNRRSRKIKQFSKHLYNYKLVRSYQEILEESIQTSLFCIQIGKYETSPLGLLCVGICLPR